jgi:putative glutamine amidotransferase
VGYLRDVTSGQKYLEALRAAGAEPIVLATAKTCPQWPTADQARALFDPANPAIQQVGDLDGLLLTGGSDIDPMLYHETIDGSQAPNWPRDHIETAQFHLARARGLPILGICRGVQFLNVAMGGSLVQDLPTADSHRDPTPKHETRSHLVRLTAGSFLARIVADEPSEDLEVGVNSYHHQGVSRERLAPGLVATATSSVDPAGSAALIEAVETPKTGAGREFVLGVQWHPERVDDPAPLGRGQPHAFRVMCARLFRAFVAAAAERRLRDESRKLVALQV